MKHRNPNQSTRRELFRLPAAAPSPVASPPTPGQPKFIVINLRGGLDTMAVLGPYNNPLYVASGASPLRTYTRMEPPGTGGPAAARHLTNAPEAFGVPKKCAKLRLPFNAQDLAFVVEVGSILPSLSHFKKQDAMETADMVEPIDQDGWLARFLDRTGSSANPPRAIGFATKRPTTLLSNSINDLKILVTPDMAELAFPGPDAPHAVPYKDSVESMFAASADLQDVGGAFFKSLGYAQGVDWNRTPHGGQYTGSPTGKALRQTAAMCKTVVTGTCPNVFHIDVGGFDTHDSEDLFYSSDGSVGNILQDLSINLDVFHQDMTDPGDNVDFVLVAMSEFGRRITENGSLGTDHGEGGIMMVMGQAVQGGQIYGQWDLANGVIPPSGNFAVSTDYREILAEIMIDRFGISPIADMAAIFPGFTYGGGLGLT